MHAHARAFLSEVWCHAQAMGSEIVDTAAESVNLSRSVIDSHFQEWMSTCRSATGVFKFRDSK